MMIVFCDGASNPRTKKAGCGCVWYSVENIPKLNEFVLLEPHFTLSERIKVSDRPNTQFPTNNEAEYHSLILALRESISQGYHHIVIYMDSQLVVKQVNNEWKINYPHLKNLKNTVDELKKDISFSLLHVKREYNTVADKLSKEAMLDL